MSIYKAYDIRGIYPSQLDEATGRRVGGALVHFLGAKTLVVGRDMRESAPSVQEAVIEGIVDAGCDVIDVGLASTPMVYFAIGSCETDGGLVVTASHNPPEYIGFKLTREQAIALSADSGIKDIEALATSDKNLDAPEKGKVIERDIHEAYKAHIAKFRKNWRPLKVVIDIANGMGGLEVPFAVEGTPLEVTWLYKELDGTFPNHEANPLKDENIEELSRKVVELGADVGFAFDGDADRCAAVDEKGQRVPSDILTAMLAPDFLKGNEGGGVVYDLRSSRIVPEVIEKSGGRPIRERVGHSFMKARLRDEGGPFGGELSGHFYFRDNFYADSGTIAMISVVNALCATDKSFTEIVAPLRRYRTTGEVNFEIEDKDGMIKKLAEVYHDGEIDYLDGITVQYQDWWFNVRKSNTEPLLRLMLEADNDTLLEEKRTELQQYLGTPE